LVKVVVNNGQYKITIPKDIALAKGWTSKTRLIVVMNSEGDIVLKEIKEKEIREKGGKSGKAK